MCPALPSNLIPLYVIKASQRARQMPQYQSVTRTGAVKHEFSAEDRAIPVSRIR